MTKKWQQLRLHYGRQQQNTEPFVLPGFVGILVFVIIPLADVFVRSFRLGGAGKFSGVINYDTVLGNDAFNMAAGNTFWFELASVPLLMLISLFVSIEVHSMKNSFVKFAFLIPLAVPSNALAVVWRMLFSDAGIVNNILVNGLGASPVKFFEGRAAFFLFVGTFVFKNIGYNMLIWISGLSAIPNELYDAAKVDGAGTFGTVWHITLPNIRRSAFIAAILSMVNSFKIFRELYLIAGSYPDSAIYQLQHVFNNWFEKLELGKLTAGAVLTAVAFFGTIIVIRILLLTQWKDMLGRMKARFRVSIHSKKRIESVNESNKKRQGDNAVYRNVRLNVYGFIGRWLGRVLHIIFRIIVLMLAVLSVCPLLFLICGTFMGENELYDMLGPVIGETEGFARWHFIPLYPTLRNVVELLFDTPEYYILFWNSVKIVGIILIGQLIFATPAAWGLAKCRKRWGKWVFGLYMFCMILPFQVTMLSQYIVLNGLNLINTHWAIILPLLFSTFPVFIMYSSFEQIPDSVVEAAQIDGAGRLRIFLNMAAPIAKKGIAAAMILGFLEYWNIVEQPVVFLKEQSLWPLSVYLPTAAEGSIGRAFTFALFSCVPSLLVFYMGKGVLADGISIGSAED